MEDLSDWRDFNPSERGTYPKVDAPLQVRFESGWSEEGTASKFFPMTGLLPVSSILAWRYIKDNAIGSLRSPRTSNRRSRNPPEWLAAKLLITGFRPLPGVNIPRCTRTGCGDLTCLGVDVVLGDGVPTIVTGETVQVTSLRLGAEFDDFMPAFRTGESDSAAHILDGLCNLLQAPCATVV